MERQATILDGMTPQQCAAATQIGAVLVLAGAGTGKTKTLTRAVANRIEVHGIPAARILAVTFTNKAAREMSERIRTTLGDGATPHWTGTDVQASWPRLAALHASAMHVRPRLSPSANSPAKSVRASAAVSPDRR